MWPEEWNRIRPRDATWYPFPFWLHAPQSHQKALLLWSRSKNSTVKCGEKRWRGEMCSQLANQACADYLTEVQPRPTAQCRLLSSWTFYKLSTPPPSTTSLAETRSRTPDIPFYWVRLDLVSTMRLLEMNTEGEFSLADFSATRVPFRIPGVSKRSASKTWCMGLERASLATIRSGSAENKPGEMGYSTFGWTRAASINQAASSSQKHSTRYFK